ncbi:MAG: class I tRNA ligase family protein [Adlercreutzia equolifaciens]
MEAAYESYRFNSVYRALYDYVNDISAVYMDVTKDRLYAEGAGLAATPGRADRAHEHPGGARARHGAHPVVHYRRGVGVLPAGLQGHRGP